MMSSKRRTLWAVLGFFLVAYFCFVGFIWWSMHQQPETFGRVMSKMPGPVVFLAAPFETMWIHARAGQLRPGDAAPDFQLATLDKTGSVQLSRLGRPVVLIFGSYT
ncbi:MAG TPA: hypothetical protein VJQ82_09675 [Terriglobales bacterium]|nr:hypothetical protein [Terriglobales bacterium]